jgi:hypothetical protein
MHVGPPNACSLKVYTIMDVSCVKSNSRKPFSFSKRSYLFLLLQYLVCFSFCFWLLVEKASFIPYSIRSCLFLLL